ncbi:MAG: helix-turn-helix domain-containing protein [Myxococcales bacterium]|nr:helix-turn-helix domain-containing protein [Myxococcales bacterium]
MTRATPRGPSPTTTPTTPPGKSGALVSAVERAARVSGRRMPSDGVVTDETASARSALSRWLVQGREARGFAREQVARVTRIPLRTLDSLEEARWHELPADVFVRGFLRGYARCVGLSVDEALARYSGCGFEAAPVASPQAQALLDSMASLAPMSSAARPMTAAPVTSVPRILSTAEQPAQVVAAAASVAAAPVVEAVPVVEAAASVEIAAAPPARRTTRRAATVTGPVTGARERDARGRFVRKSVEMAAAVVPEELRAEAEALFDEPSPVPPVASVSTLGATAPTVAEASEASEVVDPTPAAAAVAFAAVVTEPTPRASSSVRIVPPRLSRPLAAPTLTIDDDHPEEAEQAREERARARDGGWRSFLPPALLDQERGSRQGGLTLAVIILLIVATLTLSYLMRRPSSTGEGITRAPTPTSVELG